MSKLTFRITRRSREKPHGLDFGDVHLAGELGQASSRGQSPDQGMMIYISVVSLLDAVRSLLQKPKMKAVEFVGADSSFRIVFRRISRLSVRVSSNGDIAEVGERAALRAVIDATQSFLSGGNKLGETDMVWADLDAAIRKAIDAVE